MPAVVTDPTVGILLLLGALVILGTWPALMDICTLYGRNSIHIFLDYATGDFVCVLLAALTLGQIPPYGDDNPTFFTQLADIGNNWPSVLSTLGGGALLMLGNLSLQISLLMGTSLGVILPVQGALCVIISTTINYFLSPEMNDAVILFTGMFFFLVAILISSYAEVLYKQFLMDNDIEHPKGIATKRAERKQMEGLEAMQSGFENDEFEESEVSSGYSSGGEMEADLSLARAKSNSNNVILGLAVAALGGLSFGFFSPLFNIGVNDQFEWLPCGTVKLSGWTANFYFGLSFCFWAFVCSFVRMRFGSERTSCKEYIKDNNKRGLAFMTGIVCGLGNSLQFLGGMAAGFATCDMVQAFPLVGIIWGMLLFGEFRQAPRRVKVLLAFEYIVYILAVGFLAASVEEGKPAKKNTPPAKCGNATAALQ